MATEQSAFVLSTSKLQTITAGAGQDTKNATFTTMIASTAFTCQGLTLDFGGTQTDESFLVDIAVGAAASESVVINNVPVWTNDDTSNSVWLPITIASGSRISVRCQSSAGSNNLEIGVTITDDASFGTTAGNITVGADTSTSTGTTVDPGSTINTVGSYAELTASSSADMDWMAVFCGPNDNSAQSRAHYLITIATGAAASEVDLVTFKVDANAFECASKIFSLRESIPSGTRISAKSQCSINDAADRLRDVIIIGCNMTAPAGGSGGTPKLINGGLAA